VKGQLNEKDELHHPAENEGYYETQLIDDMILVQNFIFEQVKEEQMQKSYMMQKQQQYNQPINDYFYQKPTFEVNNKEKVWNNYLETIYVSSSVN